jgi:hypothetical protein
LKELFLNIKEDGILQNQYPTRELANTIKEEVEELIVESNRLKAEGLILSRLFLDTWNITNITVLYASL